MNSMQIRSAAVAGQFYPARAAELAGQVERFMAAARTRRPGYRLLPTPKALIVPHAGYVYSADIAASAYILLEGARERITRVVMLGPAHRVAFQGIALPGAAAFQTPIGPVNLDRDTIHRLEGKAGVIISDEAHSEEHCLEVHLPFLQQVLADFTIVPMLVGAATATMVEAVLDAVWGGPETLILISSDLSHYFDHDTAGQLDRTSAFKIETLNSHIADSGNMEGPCGRLPIAGLLLAASKQSLIPVRLDLRNSGDTAGSRDQVVGYGAWSFYPADARHFTGAEGIRMLGLARDAIRQSVMHGGGPAPDLTNLPAPLLTCRASFVTLKKQGALRGCIGSLEAREPLAANIVHNARAAALEDPRFDPVTVSDLDQIDISISVLCPPMPFEVADEEDFLRRVVPGRDGVIISSGARRATFLPSVWHELPQATDFLAALKRKAGIAADEWPANMKVSRYMVQEF